MRQTLRFLADQRWDYVRILADVGWPGQEIDSAAPDFEDVLGAFLDCAYLEYGLRTEITVWGGSSRDPIRAAERVARVVTDNRQWMILDLEAANESYQNGPDGPVLMRMIEILRSTGCLVAGSSPLPDASTDNVRAQMAAYAAMGAQVGTVHLDRTFGTRGERIVRQTYGLKDLPWPIAHNEPAGPTSSIVSLVDPSKLAMLRAMGILHGASAFVLHNANGVTGQPNPKYGRSGNLWDDVPTTDRQSWVPIVPIMQAVRGVDALLPEHVGSWRHTSQSGGYQQPGYANRGNILEADYIWSDGYPEGCDRNYGAVDGDRFVQLVSDVQGLMSLRAARACTVSWQAAGDDGSYGRVDLAPGEVLRVNQAFGADRIVQGVLR